VAKEEDMHPDENRGTHPTRHKYANGYRYGVRRALSSILLGTLIVYVLLFVPLPYFIYKPGTSEPVGPMVQLEQGTVDMEGAFMLTTVLVSDSNVLSYLYSFINPYDELILKNQVLRHGETREEYSSRQNFIMLDSQSNAIQAAYRQAGIPYKIITEGIIVLQVLPDMPAAKVLQAGDYVVELDGMPVAKQEDLLEYVRSKKPGDSLQVTYKRGDQRKTARITLAELPADRGESAGNPRPGLGIVFAEVHSVKPDDESKQVTIKAGEIGGPSAGLMFALQIYSQLMGEDLTKGYRVAGTGTIDPEGNVGVIGGIRHKIVAAHREKADIFFSPRDLYPKPGEQFAPVLNATDAKSQAKQIGSEMEIVPVGTLEEAIRYLRSLPPKTP